MCDSCFDACAGEPFRDREEIGSIMSKSMRIPGRYKEVAAAGVLTLGIPALGIQRIKGEMHLSTQTVDRHADCCKTVFLLVSILAPADGIGGICA
jgi:hypothetical protein